jgi:hypothetical protein
VLEVSVEPAPLNYKKQKRTPIKKSTTNSEKESEENCLDDRLTGRNKN